MPTPAVELHQVSKAFLDPRSQQLVRAMNDVSLHIGEGEFFALLGPSGCGKTTTLRAIAGFEQPDAGEILIRGRPVQGIPPFHRPVNTVFQDYALFPHMTVLQNVMFGLRMAKVPAKAAKKRAIEALELVQLPHAALRRPHQLSGGQRQRIALARALVNEPAVLLLDEPLGALDLKLRKAMQYELKKMQQHVGITFVFVTHDQEEAMTMADRIAVMNEGRVLQIGGASEIYEHPENRFVADFIGETNFLEGTLLAKHGGEGEVKLPDGRVIAASLDGHAFGESERVTVAIRPERIRLEPEGSEASVSGEVTRLKGAVREVHYIGTDTRYHVDAGGSVMLVVRQQNLGQSDDERFGVGERVVASWRTKHASVLSS